MMTVSALVIILALGIANLLASIGALYVRTTSATSRPDATDIAIPIANTMNSVQHWPFVSVHVAAHDEPADLVIATLTALARSDYPAFEVVVIDNNTPDEATWRPVADYCATLGDRFRFYHCDGVQGAKAGALNIALGLADPRADYVAVVDADYQVMSDFIAAAVSHCSPDVQFVQFPQAYRGANGANAVVAELSDYFRTFPSAANRDQASLLTGTLSMISKEALRRVGGWPTGSITEDAELGLRLWASGARGLYIDRTVGHGLLPVDLAGLRLQRQRWIIGNVQTLIAARRTLFSAKAGASAVLAQLTAWVGLLAIPFLTLAIVAIVRAVPGMERGGLAWAWRLVEWISVASFLCAMLGHLLLAVRRDRVGSMAVTFSLLWTSSFSWLAALGCQRPVFRRTPKIASDTRSAVSIDTICNIVAIMSASLFLLKGSPFTGIVLMLSAAGLVTAPVIDRSLRRAAAST